MQRRLLLAALLLPGLAACGKRRPGPEPTTVFFTGTSAVLDDNASYTIAQVAERARINPRPPIRVLGFAAPVATSASAEFTRLIANARAQAVRDALVASGVPRSRVTVGERAIVPFELAPTDSRRVEIVFGG